jgi:hypothetical protein
MKAANIQVPFVMTCQVTGLQKVFTSRDYIQKKLDGFGGNMKKMLDTYVCEDAKRLHREGKTVRQIIQALGGNKNHRDVDIDRLILDRRMSRENYRQGALHRRQGARSNHRNQGRTVSRRAAGRRQAVAA